jgi:dissimilatory sulfite reductase (desulfoviridin) alpha/beta subunit
VEAACPLKTAHVVDGKLTCGTCNNCGRCVGKCPFGVTDEYVDGYKVCIGGRWGKKTAQGRPLDVILETEEEVLTLVEKCILLFRDKGIAGERFADTLERIGFETAQAILLSDELLRRKEEILR